MSREYFFRNDDVRDTLDESLIKIQEIFIKKNVPITQAVEPANVTDSVVNWLLRQKQQYPELITFMQHGYNHIVKNKYKKGEFGGQREFDEQYEEIKAGKDLMVKYFNNQWFEAFNFPYAPYNEASIDALEKVGYKVLNSHYNVKWSRRIFYFLGHLLNKGLLFNHHVSWNCQKYPNTGLFEISMNITFIKSYLNEDTDCVFYTFDEICEKINRYIKTPYPIGLLIHHRYHTTDQHFELIEKVIEFLHGKGCQATSMEKIYEGLVKNNEK